MYLRQPNATTRIDLKDHSFRVVINTPVKDFVSTTADELTTSWLIQEKPLWFCDPRDKCDEDGSKKSSDGYTPEPFSKHKFKLMGGMIS